MTKKEKLVRELADLLTRFSTEDWLHASQRFEQVSLIAKEMAAQQKGSRKPSRQRPTDKQRSLQRKTDSTPSFELNTGGDGEDKTNALNYEGIREIARDLGIKADLPRPYEAALRVVKDALDRLSPEERLSRIQRVEESTKRVNRQENQYERWVALITKRTPN